MSTPALTPAQRALLVELAHVADMRVTGARIGTARSLERLGLARSLATEEPLPNGRGELWSLVDAGHDLARTLDPSVPRRR